MEHPELEETVALINAAQAGKSEALETLLGRYYPLILRIVELRLRRPLRGNPEAEDIVQESLLGVLQGLQQFEMRSEGSFRHWLATIVENNIRAHFRKAMAAKRGGGRVQRLADMSSSTLSASLLPGREPAPSSNARAAELEERIQHVIMNVLEDSHREVIVLRKLCGMSYEEIAETMGYGGLSSVRALCTRAMQKLKSLI